MENLFQNIVAITLGMMIFFSFVLAPMIFKILDPDNAGRFVRKISELEKKLLSNTPEVYNNLRKEFLKK